VRRLHNESSKFQHPGSRETPDHSNAHHNLGNQNLEFSPDLSAWTLDQRLPVTGARDVLGPQHVPPRNSVRNFGAYSHARRCCGPRRSRAPVEVICCWPEFCFSLASYNAGVSRGTCRSTISITVSACCLVKCGPIGKLNTEPASSSASGNAPRLHPASAYAPERCGGTG
jgi:hypothetical protein